MVSNKDMDNLTMGAILARIMVLLQGMVGIHTCPRTQGPKADMGPQALAPKGHFDIQVISYLQTLLLTVLHKHSF